MLKKTTFLNWEQTIPRFKKVVFSVHIFREVNPNIVKHSINHLTMKNCQLINSPLDNQLECGSSLNNSVLGIFVAQVVKILSIEFNNSITSLKSSSVSDTSCINLLQWEMTKE